MENNAQQRENSPQSFRSRLENFWYHYKWHSIVAIILIFAITVCSLQMCEKESYDSYVMYAGGYDINRKSESGDVSEYVSITSSLKRVAKDYDGSGEVTILLKDIFMLSEEEIKDIENSDENLEINYSLLSQNKSILLETMRYSEYYVCLISPAVYEQYKVMADVEIFMPIEDYIEDYSEAKLYEKDAALLSTTDFYTLPGISHLPKNTLLTLRRVSPFASKASKKKAEKEFKKAEEIIIEILNYKAK